MERKNVTSFFGIPLIIILLWLSACGSSGDSSTPQPGLEKSSTWGDMEWGNGTWGK